MASLRALGARSLAFIEGVISITHCSSGYHLRNRGLSDPCQPVQPEYVVRQDPSSQTMHLYTAKSPLESLQ
jgi:hypothetical protein